VQGVTLEEAVNAQARSSSSIVLGRVYSITDRVVLKHLHGTRLQSQSGTAPNSPRLSRPLSRHPRSTPCETSSPHIVTINMWARDVIACSLVRGPRVLLLCIWHTYATAELAAQRYHRMIPAPQATFRAVLGWSRAAADAVMANMFHGRVPFPIRWLSIVGFATFLLTKPCFCNSAVSDHIGILQLNVQLTARVGGRSPARNGSAEPRRKRSRMHDYLARFSTTSPKPPPDAGVVHFSSSPFKVKGRFCSIPLQLGNVLPSMWNVMVLSAR
jgi:hypothetical protein